MGKNLIRDREIIQENERLEDMFRHVMQQKKDQVKNLKEHKNKLIDFYSILVASSFKQPHLIPSLFTKMSTLIKRVTLSKSHDHLNKVKIFAMINHFIVGNMQRYCLYFKTIFT